MSLRNSGGTLQPLMNIIFCYIHCTSVHLDDALVNSKDEGQPECDLTAVLQVFQKHDFRLSSEKCRFRTKLIFWGHRVSCIGVRPPNCRISANADFPPPLDSASIRRFLRLVGLNRHSN